MSDSNHINASNGHAFHRQLALFAYTGFLDHGFGIVEIRQDAYEQHPDGSVEAEAQYIPYGPNADKMSSEVLELLDEYDPKESFILCIRDASDACTAVTLEGQTQGATPEGVYLEALKQARKVQLPAWCTDVYTSRFLWCSSEMDARAMGAKGHPPLDEKGCSVSKAMKYAMRRFWSLSERARQVSFLREHAPTDSRSMTWFSLGPMAVRDFHADAVSAYDALALVIARECGHYCDGRWFPHFSQYMPSATKKRAALDQTFLPIMDRRRRVFEMVNGVRNGLIHRDVQCTIYGGPEMQMYFQVNERGSDEALLRYNMLHWQNQVVDFGLYFALVYSELWTLMEDLARWVAARHNFKIPRNLSGTRNIGEYGAIVHELTRLEEKVVASRS